MTDTLFDLRDEAWIPARFNDGHRAMVGLRQLLIEAGRIVDLEPDPPIAYAPIVRMAAALLLRTHHAPLSDPSPAAWQHWGADRLDSGPDSKAIDDYFDTWSERFWLIHPTFPFLQDPKILTECTKRSSTNKLVMERASGNNPLWWSKEPDAASPPLPFDAAAIALVTQWAYGAGGRCATRQGIADSKQAPLRARTQFLPKGSTLWETLLALGAPAAGDHQLAARDRCVWEAAPGETLFPGQLGRLTGSPRGLLLITDGSSVTDCISTWGALLPDDFCDADVASARRPDKTGKLIPYRLRPSSTAWASAPALLTRLNPDANPIDPPSVLDPTRNPIGTTERFWTMGLDVVTHFPDQSKDLDSARVGLPGLLARLEDHDPEGFDAVQEFCRFVEELDKALSKALEARVRRGSQRAERLLPNWDSWRASAWRRAEELFWTTVERRTWAPQAVALADIWRRLVTEAFDGITDPVRLRTAVEAETGFASARRRQLHTFGLDRTEELTA